MIAVYEMNANEGTVIRMIAEHLKAIVSVTA
jgi:hypothetical protein